MTQYTLHDADKDGGVVLISFSERIIKQKQKELEHQAVAESTAWYTKTQAQAKDDWEHIKAFWIMLSMDATRYYITEKEWEEEELCI